MPSPNQQPHLNKNRGFLHTQMRTNANLKNRLNFFIDEYFSDVEIKNNIEISFGKKAKRQLGSIRMLPNGTSKITITAHFRDLSIPQYVVDETIIHEFIHYTHGFSSPLPQFYQHPHKHGIMRKEFTERGLFEIYTTSKKWLKENWQLYILKNSPTPKKTSTKRRKKVQHDPIFSILKKIRKLLS